MRPLLELFYYIEVLTTAAVPRNRNYHNVMSLPLMYIYIFLHSKTIMGFVKKEIVSKNTFVIIIHKASNL